MGGDHSKSVNWDHCMAFLRWNAQPRVITLSSDMVLLVINHSDSVPLFFSILFLWVFEIQLLMQIIINRIAIVVDNRRLIRNIKVGTCLFFIEH
jgi:hypothetical protein